MKESWKKYFTIVKYNRFVLPGIGEINANNPKLSLEKVKQAYEKGCEFIVPTDEGIQKFYPDLKKIAPKKVSIPVKSKKTLKKAAQ